ncbi:tectonic-2 isoform X2 [Ascaphus truei]|uniref:tectonic-2 isoform X1 n=1 Tax=Ascaphus truei TaxID=8439 RepID=UPI003F5A2EF3
MCPGLRVPGLAWLALPVLIAVTRGQSGPGFYPSRILLSGPRATSFLVTNTSAFSLSLTVAKNTTVVSSPGCDGSNSTNSWFLTLENTNQPAMNVYKVTLTLNRTLTLCSLNETGCCSESLCVVATLRVSACQNNKSVASLLIQAEIYTNTTFSGTASDNATVIPTQAYQPLGSCPCNLTAGACDVRCCCDQECSAMMTELFNGSCYTGVFGGNVNPPFDQLCSVQAKNRAPDWFPFLCVQSPMDNSPFLGYFYQGATVSPLQPAAFNVTFQSAPDCVSSAYKQGDPVLVEQNGCTEYFTVPQQSTMGLCERNAPVAYLHNFNATCVSNLTTCTSVLTTDLDGIVKDGRGGSVSVVIREQNITSVDRYITETGTALPQPMLCQKVIVAADYTFIWEANNLREINVNILTANLNLTHHAKLVQRFTATFVTSNSTWSVLSGNPGYQVGKPVIAANGSSSPVRTTVDLWQPVGDGACSSASRTAVLFGQDSFSGCLLQVVSETCSEMRKTVPATLMSLIPANYIAMRGNSNSSDLSEWVPIIYEEPNTTCSGECAAGYRMCLNVPANMNLQIMTAVTGAVEGIPQEEILAAKISFSTVHINCVPGDNCTLSLPISASVRFIKVPAQPPPRVTSFQVNYTDYDCDRNAVCWQHLAYPLTQYYTGEPRHLALAKGMVLVFFFIAAAVLGGPWNRIRKAWNDTAL